MDKYATACSNGRREVLGCEKNPSVLFAVGIRPVVDVVGRICAVNSYVRSSKMGHMKIRWQERLGEFGANRFRCAIL